MSKHTIWSSGGEIDIDDSGAILELRPIELGDEYDQEWQRFDRFDVAEHLAFWGLKKLHPNLDILDIGVWGKDGAYHPAEPDWRARAKANT